MNKNFEREYKEYLNAQAPDLWDRIEKGIDAADLVGMPGATQKSGTRARRKNRVRYYKLIASAAACLAALCLIVPVYRLVSREKTNETSMAASAAEEMTLTDAAVVNTEESGTAPASGLSQPSASAEMPAEEAAAVTEEAVEEIAMEMEAELESAVTTPLQTGESEESVGIGSDSAPDGSGDLEDFDMTSQKPDNASVLDAGQKEATADPEGEVAADPEEEVSIKISVLAEKEQMDAGVLYDALVIDGAGSSLHTNDMLQVMLPTGASVTFEKNFTYTVTLQKQTDTGYYAVISAEVAE